MKNNQRIWRFLAALLITLFTVVPVWAAGNTKPVGVAYSDPNLTDLYIDGTLVTSTAAELNTLDGVTASAAEINLIDGSVAGTSVASKALVLGATKNTDALTVTNATISTLVNTTLTGTTGTITNLTSTAATATTLVNTTLTSTNATITNATASNLVVGAAGTSLTQFRRHTVVIAGGTSVAAGESDLATQSVSGLATTDGLYWTRTSAVATAASRSLVVSNVRVSGTDEIEILTVNASNAAIVTPAATLSVMAIR